MNCSRLQVCFAGNPKGVMLTHHTLVTCLSLLFGFAGNPKGVMLTHHTLVTAVASLQGFVDLGNIRMGPDDSFLSFLTLAHIFDRVVEEFMLSVGGHIGYWQVRKRKQKK